MSRTLKRPMFRKGGEVMEGIMTGIKPRESFQDKGMSDAMRSDIENIQGRINLIDAIAGAGASPLANPLTQFLLQTGQNLIGGTAAGGTKLQEIVGATKDPLNKAIKAQQLRDLSKRKIAGTLLSKVGSGGLQKFRLIARDLLKQKGYQDKYGTGPAAENKLAAELYERESYRQPISDEERVRRDVAEEAKGIMSREIDRSRGKGVSYYIPSAAKDIVEAKNTLLQNKKFQASDFSIDKNQYYLPPGADYPKGDKPGTRVPSDTEGLEINNLYYNYKDKTWYLYDGVLLQEKIKMG